MRLSVLVTLRPDAFFALAVWQFARDFPSVTRFGAVDARLRLGRARGDASSAAVLFAAGVLPLLLPPVERRAPRWRRRREPAPAEFVFALLVFGAALAALAVIVWRSRLAEGTERARVRLFLYRRRRRPSAR